jgi:hypothetical protein
MTRRSQHYPPGLRERAVRMVGRSMRGPTAPTAGTRPARGNRRTEQPRPNCHTRAAQSAPTPDQTPVKITPRARDERSGLAHYCSLQYFGDHCRTAGVRKVDWFRLGLLDS